MFGVRGRALSGAVGRLVIDDSDKVESLSFGRWSVPSAIPSGTLLPMTPASPGPVATQGTVGPDHLQGGSGLDHLEGLAGDDWLEGFGGDDLLEGGDDNDSLYGGAGSDVMQGGLGDDYLEDTIFSGEQGGYDQLYGGDGADELIVDWEQTSGLPETLSAMLDGGEGDDVVVLVSDRFVAQATLIGGGGNDFINNFFLGGGVASIDAGSGNDTVSVSGSAVAYTVTLGTGADVLRMTSLAPTSYPVVATDFQAGDAGDRLDVLRYFHNILTNWDQVTNPFASGHMRLMQSGADTLVQIDRDGSGVLAFETLITLQNVAATALTGLNLGDLPPDGSKPAGRTITGNDLSSVVFGTLGDDLMQGLGGDDRLEAYAGDDRVEGGDGDDVLSGGFGNDVLVGGTGFDILRGGEGNDQLQDSGDFDDLIGGRGNDTYFIESVDVFIDEFDGEGDDTLLTSVSYILDGGTSIETLGTTNPSDTVAISLGGNELGNSIFGNAGENLLFGFDGSDQLVGLGGNDLLDGGVGADVLNGGMGDDIHCVDNIGDVVVEAANEGFDRVLVSETWTLSFGAHVEMLTTTDNLGDAAINLTGNELANIIYGNAGANMLDGGGGGDVLVGLGGDDYLLSSATSPTGWWRRGRRLRPCLAAASYTLEAGSEVELLTTVDNLATTAINLTGNGSAKISTAMPARTCSTAAAAAMCWSASAATTSIIVRNAATGWWRLRAVATTVSSRRRASRWRLARRSRCSPPIDNRGARPRST